MKSRDPRRPLGIAACATVLAVLMTACGGSSGGGSAAEPKSTTVTIVAGQPSVFLTDFYIAQQQGLFAKNGLKVEITYSQNPTAVNVSGKADLIYEPVLTGLQSISKGLALRAITTVQVNTLPILLGNKSVSSLAQLQSMKSCRIGTTAPGNTVYGYAAYWIQLLKLNCTLAIAASVPVMVAGAVSGNYAAVVTTPQYGPQTASQGTHVLLNPLKIADDGTPSVDSDYVARYALPEAITTAIWGQESYVTKNRDALKSLMTALGSAQQARKAMTISQIADTLAEAYPKAFAPSVLKHDALMQSIEYGITPVVEQAVTKELWDSSLKSYTYYGVKDYKSDNPDYAHDNVVSNG